MKRRSDKLDEMEFLKDEERRSSECGGRPMPVVFFAPPAVLGTIFFVIFAWLI